VCTPKRRSTLCQDKTREETASAVLHVGLFDTPRGGAVMMAGSVRCGTNEIHGRCSSLAHWLQVALSFELCALSKCWLRRTSSRFEPLA